MPTHLKKGKMVKFGDSRVNVMLRNEIHQKKCAQESDQFLESEPSVTCTPCLESFTNIAGGFHSFGDMMARRPGTLLWQKSNITKTAKYQSREKSVHHHVLDRNVSRIFRGSRCR